MKRSILLLVFSMMLLMMFACAKEEPVAPAATQQQQAPSLAKQGGEGDPAVLALMHDMNEQLAAMGLDIAVESIEFFTIGLGRPSNRIHQQPFRWVPNDPRRAA